MKKKSIQTIKILLAGFCTLYLIGLVAEDLVQQSKTSEEVQVDTVASSKSLLNTHCLQQAYEEGGVSSNEGLNIEDYCRCVSDKTINELGLDEYGKLANKSLAEQAGAIYPYIKFCYKEQGVEI